MAYERQNFEDGVTVLNAEHLDKMQDAILSNQEIITKKEKFENLLTFELGSVSSNGANTARTDRLRSIEYVEIAEIDEVTINSTYAFWVALYDANKSFLSVHTSTNYSSITQEQLLALNSSAIYVRFLVFNKSNLSAELNTDIKTGIAYGKNTIKQIVPMWDKLTSVESLVNGSLMSKKTTTFVQGGINSLGVEVTNTARIRSDFIVADSITKATCNAGYRIWVFYYDSDKNYLSLDQGSDSKGYHSINISASGYVRFVIVNGTSISNAITPTEDTGFTYTAASVESAINEALESAMDSLATPNTTVGAFGLPICTLQGVSAMSDATWVDNKYVNFSANASDDLSTTAANTFIVLDYSNGYDKAPVSTTTYYHKFGHCNTVDYSKHNDALILGNGSGDYTLEGKIFIIPNFSSIVNSGEHKSSSDPWTLENTNAVVIDCTGMGLGTKFNVLWGEMNGTKHNVAYLLTAVLGSSYSDPNAGDNGTIRRLLLGVGSTALDKGTIISGVADGEFNGTFKVLDTYTQSGTGYDQCCQGACYYNGEIISAIGHDGLWRWHMRLHDGKINYTEYKQFTYKDDGTKVDEYTASERTNASTCCVKDGILFMGATNLGVMAYRL